MRRLISIGLVIFLGACAAQTQAPTSTQLPSQIPTLGATATVAPSPIPPTVTWTPTLLPPTATPGPIICSPLMGIAVSDLPELIHNPFSPPHPGSDDPHQGVDFADIDPVYELALEGRPVQAVLAGQVAAIIDDRFPYGYAILVETPLEQIPSDWLETIQIPTPAPTRESHPSLTCPEIENSPPWDSAQRSVYLMYAHLKGPFNLQVGERITCGQNINTIGNSGNSLNPHLHLEARVGPSGVAFESIAHYTGRASPKEMQNYCLWRVSGTFQLLDPMLLFLQAP